MSINKTPLKWVGSKARVMSQLLPHLPKGKRLVEPFAGSGAVMMNTDYDEYLIADVNPDLLNLYRMIKEKPEAVIQHLGSLYMNNQTEEDYYRAREVFNAGLRWPLERAVYFLYLNRHCYRGVCRYNRRSHFNAPFGHYKKPYFPEAEIRAFAEKAIRATFICASYEETLQLVRPGDVLYCDPPYIPVSRTADFTQYHADGFSEQQQAGLAGLLERLAQSVPVIASNSECDLTHSLYRNFERHTITVPRSIKAAAGEGKTVSEVVAVLSPAMSATAAF